MPDQFLNVSIHRNSTFPENAWFERPDTEPATPFSQLPPLDMTADQRSPYQLFSLFTCDIIQARKVFVR